MERLYHVGSYSQTGGRALDRLSELSWCAWAKNNLARSISGKQRCGSLASSTTRQRLLATTRLLISTCTRSKADTFPKLLVLEALACGTPVVATAVGGIPGAGAGMERRGSLWRPEDAEAMAKQCRGAANQMRRYSQSIWSERCSGCPRARFDLNHQVDAYVEWYHRIAEYRDRGTLNAATLSPTR